MFQNAPFQGKINTQVQFSSSKIHLNAFASGGFTPDTAGELTALPKTPAGFQGAVSWQARGGKRREKEGGGERSRLFHNLTTGCSGKQPLDECCCYCYQAIAGSSFYILNVFKYFGVYINEL